MTIHQLVSLAEKLVCDVEIEGDPFTAKLFCKISKALFGVIDLNTGRFTYV